MVRLVTVALAAMAAACFGESGSDEYARWRPVKVLGKEKTFYCRHTGGPGTAMDRSYFPVLGGFGARRGLNEIDWYNRYTDSARRASIARPYTVWDTFGPEGRRGPGMAELKKLHETRPDVPFVLHGFLDSWFPWFMEDAYDCDQRSYAEFRRTYTNFVGFTTLNESCSGFRHYSSKDVTNIAMKAKMDAAFPPASTYRDRIAWLDRTMSRQKAMYFGETNRFMVVYSTNLKWGHVLAKYGVGFLEYESESCVLSGPNRFSMAHVRGAGRQYQVPWSWYTAQLILSSTRDGKDVHAEWRGPTEWMRTWYPKNKPWNENCGTARSIIKRSHVYGYFAGANVMALENPQYFLMDHIDGKDRLSKYGRDIEEVMQLAEKTPRGFCYTPAAVLTGFYEPFGISGGNGWGLDAFFFTLVPVLSEDGYRHCDRSKGEQGIMFNSEFGELCDVVTPDAAQKPGEFAAAFAPYKWAFMMGDYDEKDFERTAVEQWVKNGGTLVTSVDYVMNDAAGIRALPKAGLVSSAMAGVAFTTNVVTCGEKLIERATKRVCEGSMLQTFSRVADGRRHTAPFDYQLHVGRATTAKPLYVDESGNVIAWENPCGKGKVITMAAVQGVPRILSDHKRYFKELPVYGFFGIKPEIVAGRITFPLQRELLRRCQRETMPVTVQGDVQWGVNKVEAEGRGREGGWLVWLLNNKGVRKFAFEEEEIDHAFDAVVKVTSRETGKSFEVKVPAGGYATVRVASTPCGVQEGRLESRVAQLTIEKPSYAVRSSDPEVKAMLVRTPAGRLSLSVENGGSAKELEIVGWDDYPQLPRLYLGTDKSRRPKRAIPPADWKLRFRLDAGGCALVTTDYDDGDQPQGPVRSLTVRVDPAKPLLMVPVYSEIVPCTTYKCNYGYTLTDVSVDGTNVLTFSSDRPDGGNPVFHSPIDLSAWAGKILTVSRRDCWCEDAGDSFRDWHFASRDELPADLGDEVCRPQFHFTARWGWSNDPNGLSYYGGKWHLFYQAVPCTTVWRPSNRWGHAVSEDLLTWRDEPPALEPDAESAVWSGSAVTDSEGVAGYGKGAHLLFFTRHPWDHRVLHDQVLAYSTDGRTYRKGLRIIAPTTDGARDPFVFFHRESGKWVLLLNEEPPEEFGFTVWNSDNLRDWDKVGYIKGDRKDERIVPGKPLRRFLSECPWMAKVKVEDSNRSLWVVGGGDASYQVGDFDGRRFRPLQDVKEVFPLRIGPGASLAWQRPYYAGQIFNGAPDGRIVYMPWYKMQTPPGSRFSQAMGLPLEFTLVAEAGGGHRLRALPVRELEGLRCGEPVAFSSFRGELVEFEYAAEVASESNVEFDLRGVRLVYDGKVRELRVGESVRVPWSVPNGRLELRGWLDRCGLEVFSGDGFQVLPDPTALPDPRRKDISVRSQGASDVHGRAWVLKSVMGKRG